MDFTRSPIQGRVVLEDDRIIRLTSQQFDKRFKEIIGHASYVRSIYSDAYAAAVKQVGEYIDKRDALELEVWRLKVARIHRKQRREIMGNLRKKTWRLSRRTAIQRYREDARFWRWPKRSDCTKWVREYISGGRSNHYDADFWGQLRAGDVPMGAYTPHVLQWVNDRLPECKIAISVLESLQELLKIAQSQKSGAMLYIPVRLMACAINLKEEFVDPLMIGIRTLEAILIEHGAEGEPYRFLALVEPQATLELSPLQDSP